ncbi:MAG: ATP-binding cassette domain-containing protein [Micromonosporaceae bacterium]
MGSNEDSTAPPPAASPSTPSPATATSEPHTVTIRIGRDPSSHIVLPDLWVSRHHAEVRRIGSKYHIVDTASSNGLHHNGRRVTRAVLAPGDRITIGRYELVFDGERLHEHIDTGPASLAADDLTVRLGEQVLLDDVGFVLRAGCLLGIIGPSGCGKSTLIRALTGIRPATQGTVHYDGRDLYAEYAELRYRIGIVPQDDVLHRQLTVRRALRFAASLRFADDVPRSERAERVEEVMATLGIAPRATQRIDTLSGGQRKRTSVALELLTEPALLVLDEPTSGLDPALDKEVMRELREMADSGRTVVIVTHSVLHLGLCDRVLVMCQGGRMGYFGPPDTVLDFFEAEDYADVFDKVTNDAQRWAQRYRNSDSYRTYVGEVALQVAGLSPVPSPPVPAPRPPVADEEPAAHEAATHDDTSHEAHEGAVFDVAPVPAAALALVPAGPAHPTEGAAVISPGAAMAKANGLKGLPLRSRALHPVAPLRQFATLCLRMLAVVAADRGYALFLLGLPLALALLTHSVPGEHGLAPASDLINLEAQRILVVLVVGASFLGIAVSIREIVSEASIYRRERTVGLAPGAYLASKIVVFTLIVTVQTVLFVWLSLIGRSKPVDPLVIGWSTVEIMVPVALVAIASTVLGLVISTLARTAEQTTPVLVVTVMAQLVLSGGLFELGGEKILNPISWISPTRWGFAAGSSTVDLQGMIPFLKDSLWAHSAAAWWRSVVILLIQIAVLIGGARLALRRLEPGRD